jgi:hypothetical protein
MADSVEPGQHEETVVCDLTDQDFDLPCGITTRGEPCSAPAEWWAQFKGHHDSGTFDRLLCPAHYEHVMAGGKGRCVPCQVAVVFKDGLLRIERIKP